MFILVRFTAPSTADNDGSWTLNTVLSTKSSKQFSGKMKHEYHWWQCKPCMALSARSGYLDNRDIAGLGHRGRLYVHFPVLLMADQYPKAQRLSSRGRCSFSLHGRYIGSTLQHCQTSNAMYECMLQRCPTQCGTANKRFGILPCRR